MVATQWKNAGLLLTVVLVAVGGSVYIDTNGSDESRHIASRDLEPYTIIEAADIVIGQSDARARR